MTLFRPSSRHYVGLLLVSMGTLLWEILLTRIYSVILYYHFAFLAVSVALFGLTVGALLSYGIQDNTLETLDATLAKLAASFAVLASLAIFLQLRTPPPQINGNFVLFAFWLRIYLLSTLPFIPAGIYVSLALTRFQGTGRLYAADLLGASLGAACLPSLITGLHGPGAVLAISAVLLATASLHLRPHRGKVAWGPAVLGALFGLASVLNLHHSWIGIRWAQGGLQAIPLYESWNAFSRIAVNAKTERPFGWGIDKEIRSKLQPDQQLVLAIDSGASTPLTRYDASHPERLEFLKSDITNVAHYLRKGPEILIIGPGGGRDVLSALQFGSSRVTAVEVNAMIVQAVNRRFGDFTGHLDQHPNIRFEIDEGRSFITRSSQSFDLIQASLVDTAAATAAGAFAFVENGLYTVEAWQLFLRKLRPEGMISFSRWYYGSTIWPVELCRSVALAWEALRQTGIEHPLDHLIVVKNRDLRPGVEGLATLVVSRSPFSEADIKNLQDVCQTLRCEVACSPQSIQDPWLKFLINEVLPHRRYDLLPLDTSAPTDNRPYFFFHARFRDILRGNDRARFGGSSFNLPAVRVLLMLFAIASVLAVSLMAGSYAWLKRNQQWKLVRSSQGFAAMPYYFAAIGVAFMLVEISLMQRFSLILGHPTYGFTVVLLGLLGASGLGSWLTAVDLQHRWAVRIVFAFCLFVSGLHLLGMLPYANMAAWPSGGRIAASLLALIPPGILMGTFFPRGMNHVLRHEPLRAPWYWALNGACSVLGSIVAMMVTLACGLQAALLVGAGIYVTVWMIERRLGQQAPGV